MNTNGTEDQIRAFLQDSHLLRVAASDKRNAAKLRKWRQDFIEEQARLLARMQFCTDAIERLTAALGDLEA